MILRRIIIALCLLSLFPTAIDPSCVRYFIYSNGGSTATATEQIGDDGADEVTSAARPVEVLAAARIPSHFQATDLLLLDVIEALRNVALRTATLRPETAPDFLAPSQRASFLRHSVLLI